MEAVPRSEHLIPTLLNVAICALCSAIYLLLIGSLQAVTLYWGIALLGLLFAMVMIPIYSLLHEAEHSTLHPDPRWNDALGLWLGILFGVSFTFFRHCHIRHHKKNRTDLEMWDLFTEDHVKWKRYLNLYLMMSGIGYSLIFLSTLLFATFPKLLFAGLFQRHNELAGFLEGSDDIGKIKIMRREAWSVIAVQGFLLWVLNVPFPAWLAIFAIHAFVWSSQNYVNHAFSKRDIVNGAHNLAVPGWLAPLYLHFNLHLAHHQHPQIPWIHLPKLVPSDTPRMSFFANYLRLWGGPRFTSEPDPAC